MPLILSLRAVLILPLAVHWSDDHPVRNLVEAHYYQQLCDTYNAVRRSLQSEIRVYMAAYVKSLPTPKIKYLLETFQGILQNFKTNKPENPDVAKKTLMEEHSSVSLSRIYLWNTYCH